MNTKTLRGIDISEHNGHIDFEKLKEHVDFVIMRCGYGRNFEDQKDKTFEYNSSECERLHIPYGVYLYSYAQNAEMAKEEAEHALALVKGKKIDCGIWFDMEDEVLPNEGRKLSTMARSFVERIEDAGYLAGVYSSLSWFEYKLTGLYGINKWVAQWNDCLEYDGDSLIWQYSSAGRVPGVDTRVDMNIAESTLFESGGKFSTEGEEDVESIEILMTVIAEDGLNIRRSCSVDSEIKGAVRFGTVLHISEIIENEGLNWGYITAPKRFSGMWACVDYCAEVNHECDGVSYIVTPYIGLNVRTAPTVEAEIITALPNRTEVMAQFTYNGWMRIVSPVKGWAKCEYLEEK